MSDPVFVDPVRRPEDGRYNLLKYVEFIGKEPGECRYIEVGKCLLVEYLKKDAEEAQPVLDTLMMINFKESIDEEIRDVLRRGIFCGTRFDFLGYSNENLQERCCLMITGKADWQSCINDLTDIAQYHTVYPTEKLAEQFGVLFSCFTHSLKLKGAVEVMNDHQGQSAHCGLMSSALSKEIQNLYGLTYAPSVVHIRYQGYQGLLRRRPNQPDPDPPTVELIKSMEMFKVSSRSRLPDALGILGYSEPYSMGYLDTLSIMLLVNKGVEPEYIEKLQDKYHGHLIAVNHNMAQWLLPRVGMSNQYADLEENIRRFQREEIKKMRQEGMYKDSDDESRQKVRILVFRSREVYGLRDANLEPRLKPGQCFFKPTLPGGEEQQYFERAKRLLVMRRPCYNPDHIRVLELVHSNGETPKEFQSIQDCLVLGGPSDFDECGGGKLDSDSAKYFVCWDDGLIPEKPSSRNYLVDKVVKQANSTLEAIRGLRYSAGGPGKEEALSTDLKEFFVSFTNPLPSAQELFMRYASSEGPSSEKCRRLSEPLCGKMDTKTQREKCESIVEELKPKNDDTQEDGNEEKETDQLLVVNIDPQQDSANSCLSVCLFWKRSRRQSDEGEVQANLETVLRSTEREAQQFLRNVK